MWHDVRLAVITLRRSPLFATMAVATLGLGIGANGVVFSVVDQLLVRPLPFGERSPRLITLHSTHATQAVAWDDADLSVADVEDVRTSARSLDRVEGFFPRNLSLAGAEDSERMAGASVTAGLFGMLDVRPWLGRGFRADDAAEPGFEQVILIGYGLWERRFGADPGIVGRTTTVNGRNVTIIGVMPPGFRFPEAQDVWLPYAPRTMPSRDQRTLTTVALMTHDATLPLVQRELDAVAERLARAYPDSNRGWGIKALEMRTLFVDERTSRGVAVMLTAVGLVLLVACTNIASLLIARALGRRRELTVRAALGANRATLLRLLLSESLVLAAAGAFVAVLAALWGIDALRTSMPEPPPFWVHLSLDGRVLGFLFVLTALTTAVFGLLPAWRATRVDLVSGLNDSGRTATSAASTRAQGALLVGQIGVSLTLLVGASLLTRSAMRLADADTGFDPRPLLSLRFYISGDAYDSPQARHDLVARVVARIDDMPGVDAAAATGVIPADDGGDGIRLVPERLSRSQADDRGAQLVPITPGFAETLGLPLRSGREMTPSEAGDPASEVVLVNQTLADRFWPGETAIDRRLGIRRAAGVEWFRVVGVLPDLVYEEVGEQSEPSRLTVYQPYARAGWRTMALLVRATGDPAALTSAIRRAIHEVDPLIAPFDVQTMVQRKRATQWGEHFIGRVFASFAAAALLLACVGAYGLMTQGAGRRTRELGIRVVLGASRGAVRHLLLHHALRLVVAGLVLGLPMAAMVASLLQRLLYDVSPFSVGVWAPAVAALATVVMAASYLPAWRASRVDPIVALREE